ncbi:MAG: AAA family ATPase [Prevotella sp.]|nr:AAA family ATPase [Prevotella sp.]
MIIKSIILNNYRLYKGVNKLSLSSSDEKNIILISGENGFGKTTFLHSLIWCLYGKLIADVVPEVRKEININGYNSFLHSNMNNDVVSEFERVIDHETRQFIKKKGYTTEIEHLMTLTTYSVSIEFGDVIIPSLPCTSIKISRSYDIVKEKEFVDILIDGAKNELANEIGPDVFINDFILNKDIARFFFFDSEQIVALAETGSANDRHQLCSAYNEVLGVRKYEDLKKNLENVCFRFRRKSSDTIGREKLQKLFERKESLTVDIETNKEQTINLESELKKLREEDAAYQLQLMREGYNTTTSEIACLEALINTLRVKDDEYKKLLKQFIEYAPIAIIGRLLNETKSQLENDYKKRELANNQNSRNIIVSDITSEMLLMLERLPLNASLSLQIQEGIQNIVTKYKENISSDNTLLVLSENDYEEFMAIYNNITTTYRSEFARLADDYRKNKQMLERNSRRLSNINSKESDELIKRLRAEKNQLEDSIEQQDLKLRQMHEKYGTLNQEISTVNKQISELSKKVRLDDYDTQKDKVAATLIEELSTFLVSLKQEKKYSLERRIKSILNSIMHKEDFIGQVEVVITGEVMDIELYSKDGIHINKDSLSKGEQQLYATSILKSLVEESGIQFPVFIDSPLQKFDKSHASKIITEFYPQISKQVVLFPLLYKELTPEEYEIMKPLISSTYLIENDTTHSYFRNVPIDEFMKGN